MAAKRLELEGDDMGGAGVDRDVDRRVVQHASVHEVVLGDAIAGDLVQRHPLRRAALTS